MNVVGNNIKRFRENEGITQEGLALKSGLSQGYINQLENGKRRYTQKTLELIAESLSVPVVELFKEDDKKHHSNQRCEQKQRLPFAEQVDPILIFFNSFFRGLFLWLNFGFYRHMFSKVE